MTDTEIAKSVADACEIEVFWNQAEECWFTSQNVPFDPATYWNDTMIAAGRRGLFEKHHAELSIVDGQWMVWLPLERESEVFANSGPRAICEAILAVKGVQE